MKSLHPRGGYTIIEVMIVLAVSAALLGSSVTLINQQNRRTAFNQTVRDLELKIQDILNDVDTGFYPTNNNFSCIASSTAGTAPTITANPNEQGKNEGCIFIGKALHFAPALDSDSLINIYTVVGRKNTGSLSSSTVTDMVSAKPIAIYGQENTAYDTYNLSNALRVSRVYFPNSGGVNTWGIGILSSFGGSTSSESGNVNVLLSNIPNMTNREAPNTFDSAGVQRLSNSDVGTANNGVVICLQEGTNGRKAAILIGQGAQRLGVETEIDNVPSGPGECP